jgi:hypothetical protein
MNKKILLLFIRQEYLFIYINCTNLQIMIKLDIICMKGVMP